MDVAVNNLNPPLWSVMLPREPTRNEAFLPKPGNVADNLRPFEIEVRDEGARRTRHFATKILPVSFSC